MRRVREPRGYPNRLCLAHRVKDRAGRHHPDLLRVTVLSERWPEEVERAPS